ncbi:S8 family peptidase [Oceanobacillus timonensis]|uniref:S8 family peptidase n=1 Tax=Oceanobacillus timonensis TaxID=1926285 RepID=UPI0009B9341F|nr:S8 family serine peptidase [Oceanobacillus timonensis]
MELLKSTVTYAHPKLRIDDYWNRGITGQGVKVAAIDDPIYEHEALPIVDGMACGPLTAWKGTSEHPTHCAGIACAKNLQNGQPAGVAPDAEYYHIRMFLRTYGDRIKSLVEAIDYSLEKEVDILFMSIHIAENSINYDDGRGSSAGTPKHLRIKMREAFFKAYKNGLIIVVAGGNHNDGRGEDNIEFEELLPKMPNVITVANLTPVNTRREASGVGKWVDVAGYGSYIKSTIVNDNYGKLSGTSMSTPQIAGIIALYKQLFSDLPSQEIIEKVFDNCEKVPGLNSEQQGRGVPMPPAELYSLPILDEANNQFRRYTDYTWQATEAYAKKDGKWIETEAMGYV